MIGDNLFWGTSNIISEKCDIVSEQVETKRNNDCFGLFVYRLATHARTFRVFFTGYLPIFLDFLRNTWNLS